MSPTPDEIREALAGVIRTDQQLEESVRAVLSQLRATELISAGGAADVDLDRAARCGFSEVIYGEGKPAHLIVDILKQQEAVGQRGFVTRLDSQQADDVLQAFPDGIYNSVAGTVVPHGYPAAATRTSGTVAIVTAGSCDAPVAQEAVETLKWMGVAVQLIEDVGVAGPHRLQKHVPVLQSMAAVVVVAGMEAALPSVVGGYVGCPVIGVPTSVGYGASLGGLTALLSMLTSCASNVVTVNVDAGFRGGYVAGMIARQSVPAGETPS